jgi:hypothetical protein
MRQGGLTSGLPNNNNNTNPTRAGEHRRHTLCASERLPANPLAAVAQQWAMDPEGWAKASATYAQAYNQALASQQHNQPFAGHPAHLNQGLFQQQMAAALHLVQQQNQQAQALASANPNMAGNLIGLMGLRNGLVDYSRMMRLPTTRKLFNN